MVIQSCKFLRRQQLVLSEIIRICKPWVCYLDSSLRLHILGRAMALCWFARSFGIYSCILWRLMICSSFCLYMCYRALTYNEEILACQSIFLSHGNTVYFMWGKKKKNPVVSWLSICLMLWTILDLRRDKGSGQYIYSWAQTHKLKHFRSNDVLICYINYSIGISSIWFSKSWSRSDVRYYNLTISHAQNDLDRLNYSKIGGRIVQSKRSHMILVSINFLSLTGDPNEK